MTPGLITRLVLPLLALIAVSGVLHWQLETDGLWLNLLTELVGIIVTVVYVDWVLRKHEERRWKDTTERVAGRLQYLVATFVTGVRISLGYGPEIFDDRIEQSTDPAQWRKEGIRICREVLEPTLRTRLDSLDQDQWLRLTNGLNTTWSEAGRVFAMFERRLTPKQQTLLLDLQNAIHRAVTFYTTFPDLAGVPDNQLPQTKTPPELLKRHGYDSTAKDLRQALGLARQLDECSDS